MSVSGITGSGGYGYSPVSRDYQVKSLQAKIEDWKNCPTTDPATKRAIVDRLQAQLDSLTARLEKQTGNSAEVREPQSSSRLDIVV